MKTELGIDMVAWNQRLVGLGARERIEAAYREFGDDLILATSFGPTAGVMLRLATQVVPGIRVVTVRHGYESERTLELAGVYRRELGLNLRVYEAPKLVIPEEGTPAFEEFKRRVKVEPFQRALREERPRAWLSGVMGEETEARRSFDYAMWRDGLVVVYPILDWVETDAVEYCLAHGLPINRSYYDPTKGLDQKSECGLHLGRLGTSWTDSGL
jgi:phosphoadenosine phosphosulfate reductase